VLVPVLDNDKHYWVGDAEVDKLLRHAETWLADHPLREQIAKRYLRFQRRLTRELLSRLAEQEDPDADEARHGAAEERLERPLSLAQQRVDAVLAVVEASGARQVVDLGCGEGRYVAALLKQPRIDKVVGVDVAASAIERAEERLDLSRMNERQRARVELLHGSFTYRDARLTGMDVALAIEVIEHLEPDRVDAFTRNLLGFVAAPVAVVTTPNAEFNVRFAGLAAGAFRHDDHRFEWTRAQFRAWAEGAAAAYGYTVELLPVGEVDAELGAPTQMAVFRRRGAA
jgi:3' terminal RNA ribose 2'-O-methyltransferase Hen1